MSRRSFLLSLCGAATTLLTLNRCFAQGGQRGGRLWRYDAQHFVKEVVLESDTDMGVLSFVPALPDDNPVSMREAAYNVRN
jgi:hypothetical protein